MITKNMNPTIDIAYKELRAVIDRIQKAEGAERDVIINKEFFCMIVDPEKPKFGEIVLRNLEWLKIASSDGWRAVNSIAAYGSDDLVKMLLDMAIANPSYKELINDIPNIPDQPAIPAFVMAISTLKESRLEIEKKYTALADELGLRHTEHFDL